MKSQARVVIIGGGVVGTSILYHLTKAGWNDVVLLERDQLTAGSTWHAAGLLPLFNMSYAVGQIHKYSVDLYPALEKETGQSVSFHQVGNLRLANNKTRMDEYLSYASTAATIGVDVQTLTPDEVKKLWPLAKTDDLYGAIFHSQDGHIAPVDLTQAFAKAAKDAGAQIYQKTEAIEIEQLADGEWLIRTNNGDIRCEKIVSASGNYARQTLAKVGLDIPAIPVEHQFIVTDEIPELVERHKHNLPELPVLRESDASYYMREERQGLILGPYEKGAPCWGVDGVPKGFGQELLPPDLDRLEPHIEAAIRRVPCFEKGGVKDCVNGPICYTPDGNPLIGPAPNIRNFYVAEGFSFGITAAGGAGKYLTEMITEGEASIDTLAVDTRRFGPWATKEYARLKNEECYAHVFVTHFPDEERPAARPFRTTPCYDRLKERGAVFGQVYGWERANWFAPDGVKAVDDWSFRRSNYFEHVSAEVMRMHNSVSMIDMSGFSKNIVSGVGAQQWLEGLIANKMPKKGRINLSHALKPKGGVRSEFTVLRTGANSFYLVSAGAQEMYDLDYLKKQLPQDNSVSLENVTTKYGVFVISGPNSRALLQKLTDTDLGNDHFPWLSGKPILLGMAPVYALRVNFVGELGWEIHHPIEMQNYIFDLLEEAGKEFDMGMMGMRAMFSMALEKSYRNIGKELSVELTALESSMDRFVRMKKKYDFVGKEALSKQKEEGKKWHFVTLEVDSGDMDPVGSEAIYSNNEIVGRVTTGGYGRRVKKSLALGFVRHEELAKIGTELKLNVIGTHVACRVVAESPFDPGNTRLCS